MARCGPGWKVASTMQATPEVRAAVLETARGVANVEEICGASPRMQGLSLGPADLAANRRMKTTRVGGGHPDYIVRQDPNPDNPDAPRSTYQQDLWHYTMARMVDACVASQGKARGVATVKRAVTGAELQTMHAADTVGDGNHGALRTHFRCALQVLDLALDQFRNFGRIQLHEILLVVQCHGHGIEFAAD